MSAFEFMMVLTSIIVALAMTEILAGFVRILKSELTTWWVHSTYVFAGFIGIQQLFWDLYGYSDHPVWYFSDMLLVFVGPCVLYYLATALAFPPRGEGTDLKAHYWQVSRPLFGTLVFLMPLFTLGGIRTGVEAEAAIDIFRIGFFAVYLTLAISKNERLHKALALVHLALLVFFIANNVLLRTLTS